MSLYDILGVAKDATQETIKSAFRFNARQYHPDNQETGDAEKFKELREAYEILFDPITRKRYDATGYTKTDENTLSRGSISIIRSFISKYLKDDSFANTNDFVEEIKAHCKSSTIVARGNIIIAQKQITKITKFYKKFKKKTEENSDLIKLILTEEVTSIKSTIHQHYEYIDVLEHTLMMINNYEYDFCKLLETDNIETIPKPKKHSLGSIFDFAK